MIFLNTLIDVYEMMFYIILFRQWETVKPGPVFHLPSSLLKLSKVWDANFTFNYFKQIHFLSQCFENLLKQGT